MEKPSFEEWSAMLMSDRRSGDYFVDYSKAVKVVSESKDSLDFLDKSMQGSVTPEEAKTKFIEAASTDAGILNLVFLMFAYTHPNLEIMGKIRREASNGENFKVIDWEGPTVHYSLGKLEPNHAACLLDEVGFFDFYVNTSCKAHPLDMCSYLAGVKVGMDTHARKNRSGAGMEDLVEFFIADAGYVKNDTYFRQIKPGDVKKRIGVDLSRMDRGKDGDNRFDFLIIPEEGPACIVEVNYYASKGSKPTSTMGNYLNMFRESKSIDGIRFVWITDGQGWSNKKKDVSESNLKPTYEEVDDVFCIRQLEEYGLNELLGVRRPSPSRNTFTQKTLF